MAKINLFNISTIVAAKKVLFRAIPVPVAFGLILVSCAGTGSISEAVRSAPSIDAVAGLNDKLLWIKSHAESGSEYVIALDSDEGALKAGNLTYKNKSNITITIKSTGENRTISPATSAMYFTVGSGVTLILDSNVTVRGLPNGDGLSKSINSLVSVSSGGTFVMNGGSAVVGNTNNFSIQGGGVCVWAGGAFYMNGGNISGNKCIAGNTLISSTLLGQAMAGAITGAASKKLSENSNKNTQAIGKMVGDAAASAAANPDYPIAYGGGVYVSGTGFALFGKPDPAGIFVKNGGTITGYDSDSENGNVVMNGGWPSRGQGSPPAPYTVSTTGGHAIYFDGSAGTQPKSVNTTVGPGECFEFRNGVYTDKQCATPPPQQPPQETVPPVDDADVSNISAVSMPKIAVYAFGAKVRAVDKAMAARLLIALSGSGKYQASEAYSEFFEYAAAEQKNSAKPINPEQIKRLGQQFGVAYICVAEIKTGAGENRVFAQVFDVETAEIVAMASGAMSLKTLAELTVASKQIVEMMSGSAAQALPAPPATPVPAPLPPPPEVTPVQPAETASAEQPLRDEPSIAAYVFGAKDSTLNRAMVARLIVELANTGRYQVSEDYGEFFDQAVREQKNNAGVLNVERLKYIGQRFGVDYVCVTNLVSVFGEYRAFAYMLRVKNGVVAAKGASDISLKTLPDLTAASEQIVKSMFEKKQSSSSAPPASAPTSPHIAQSYGQPVSCPPCGESIYRSEEVASASTRKSKTGFTVGYGFSGDATIFQLGAAHVRPIASGTASLVVETNFWAGRWTERREVTVSDGYILASKNYDEKFSCYGVNIPVLFKAEKSAVFAEGGVFFDLLSGTADNSLAGSGYSNYGNSDNEWMVNAGVTVGGGLSFGKGYTQYFYRFNYGLAYYSQVIGIRQLF